MTPPFAFDNSYARLPPRFFAAVRPTPVAQPALIRVNQSLAADLGLDPALLASPMGVEMLAGNSLPKDATPLAMAYAGHQFGHFSPQLGDGRAILLGEIVDPQGARRDIQLKGSGITPFSRRGDGRAALGPVLREYLVSEAMASFGIPTTRALAAVTTGENVMRETPLPGAILTRVASSHIRIGSFQFFAARGDGEAVRQLADYVIARHFPSALDSENSYRALLDQVILRQAALIAQWLLIGFIHGVMNTDNMAISGETIDFGPCAFMDEFDPAKVFSSIDEMGRYAYGNQPRIAQWNLARFAETLLPLLADDENAAIASAEAALGIFPAAFEAHYVAGMRHKLGLLSAAGDDLALAQRLLQLMAAQQIDFTLTFRGLCDVADQHDKEAVRRLFDDPSGYDAWETEWRLRLQTDGQNSLERKRVMQNANPYFIPRNHHIEAVIRAAVDKNDLAPFNEMAAALSDPHTDRPEFARYAQPPHPEERVRKTFCGT